MRIRSLEKASKLPQTTTTWQATVRMAPTWIEPKNQPRYRPYLVFVLDTESDTVRLLIMQDQRPAAGTLLSLLANAITKPMMGSGGRYRPARILIDDQELAQALAPQLAEIGIGCEYAASLPALEAVLRDLSAHLNPDAERDSVLGTPRVTLPLLADFYAAAAHFYQQAPWRWADNLMAIEVRYPATGPARYVVIMGFGGQEFGLALYPTLADLRWQLSGLEPPAIYEKLTTTSLTFGEDDVLAFEDLDAIAKHGWPVAGPNAYPLLMKITPPVKISVPSADEIALFAAAARTLPDFVMKYLKDKRIASSGAEAIYPLSNVHANQQIAYRYPVDLPELVTLREQAAMSDQEIEEMITDWYWDEESHAFAHQIGALLLDFLNYVEATRVTKQSLRKYETGCWLIGKLTCKCRGDKPFTPDMFLGGPHYLDELRQEVGNSSSIVSAYQTTWRKLERFLRTQNYV